MNRKNFGKILKSLRQEQFNYQNGRFWTQKELAKEADLSEGIIGKIEQGRRVNLTAYELGRLSNALRLSTLEQQEFFVAGTAVDQEFGVVEARHVQESFDTVWKRFSILQEPSYLTDSLGNLVGINAPMMRFHGITQETLQKNQQKKTVPHILNIFFRPDSPLRSAMSHRWYEPALSNVRQFQFTSLRYRYTRRFEDILSLLYKQPDFYPIWQQSRSDPTDIYSMVREFDYKHQNYGPVHYVTTVTPTLTPYGSIYMTVFVAGAAKTNRVFNDLLSEDMRVQQLMTWPDNDLIM